ncbi:protein kinase domain-containing protein [Mycolicibacterium peregrinum]|uniref:protein kinase domain-containing protein n=1 Tax=Mycolicibacterium peregrinum TaxID=43304 RepID=UPI000B14B53C|nr:NERD domain-containing protein [Mycolicibacterium peregrinum]
MIRQLLPAASPYRAWTNFEFMDGNGQWHEIDALVLGRRRLHLVELKAFTGIITGGNEQSWTILSMGGRQRTQRSPLLLTRRKAQRLKSRIEEEARKISDEIGLDWEKVRRGLPYIQESVFLHGSPFSSKLTGLATSSLFGPDGRESEVGLPGISERLLEAPADGRRVDGDMELIVANALQRLGIAKRTERTAGSWTIAGNPFAAGDDWQQFEASNKISGEKVIARVVSLRPGTPTQARAAAYRRVQREYALLSSLHHESIVAPRDLVQDDAGNTVLVYPETPGFEPLDLVVADVQLSLDQQFEVLTRVAEALAYAHKNHVAHRGLGPSAILIDRDALSRGTVDIRIVDWSFAGRIHSGTTNSATLFGVLPDTGAADVDDVYQAPEDRWSADADRIALDLFSLGAVAYYLLGGAQAPAASRPALLERLRRENGLDLAAAGGQFIGEPLRALVLQATCPNVSKRLARNPHTDEPTFGAQQFVNGIDDFRRVAAPPPAVDPLNPAIQDMIDGRYEVIEVLGSGSTARGILVVDTEADDEKRVLKVGLDDAAAARLHEEAEVLRLLADAPQPVPGVVALIEGPLNLDGGRTALLLSNCGEKTLADIIRYTALPESQLNGLGSELLDIVVGLEAAGIAHRDIKPSNLGLSKNDRKRSAPTHLALFDFSLSRAPIDNLTAGTPPYRDPFLGEGMRVTYDSAAERYAAAVVLYEMATNSTPIYGDPDSAPSSLTDDVSVSPDDFVANGYSATRANALVEFFRRSLARDVKSRYDTASAMRAAWADVFSAAAGTIPVHTPQLPRPAEPEPRPDTYRSVSGLMDAFVAAAGARPTVTRRQIVEMVLGLHPNSPSDPFTTYPEFATAANVTGARIAQVFGEFKDLWRKDETLAATVDRLRRRLIDHLEESGGASTPDLVAQSWTGDILDTRGLDHPERYARGILRLVLASYPATGDESVVMVRRQGTGTVAMIAFPGVSRQLPAALADEVEKLYAAARQEGAALVSISDAEPSLRATAARTLAQSQVDLQITTSTLLRIGANASAEIALSARDEIHGSGLSIDAALREVLQGVSVGDSFTRSELESRVSARFPALTARMPRRLELDRLVEAVAPGVAWDEKLDRYRFADGGQTSTLPSHHTRIPLPKKHFEPASDVERILRASAREGTYRGLGIPMGQTDAVARDLEVVFNATHIDVTAFLLARLRSLAISDEVPWGEVLDADRQPGPDRAALEEMVAQVIPDLVDAVNVGPGPVVLTDLSTLCAYGQLNVLHAWADISGQARHAVWSLIPQPNEVGGGPGALIDGEAFPRTAPEQFVQLGVEDLVVLRGLAVGVVGEVL